MKRKVIAAFLSAALAATALTACGGTGNTSSLEKASSGKTDAETSTVTEPINITLMYADNDEGAREVINGIIDQFNEEQDEIFVNVEPGNGTAYSEFLKTKDSVGEFPDVMEMQNVAMTEMYVRAKKLEPLSDELVSLFKSTDEFDGVTYTAPISNEAPIGIIYNKTYFNDNGFEEPTTYDDFIKLCQDIKQKGDMVPLVVGGQDWWHMKFWYGKVYNDQINSKYPDFLKECYAGTKDWSDPAVKASFEEMATIMEYAQEGWSSTPDAQITTFLVNNMAAMMYSGPHMFKQIASADPDFEMGWFAVPSPDGKTRLLGKGADACWAISAESAQDPDKKAAAEEFIKYFFRDDNYKKYCETIGRIPVTKDAPELDASPVFQTVIDATESADYITYMWDTRVGDNELPPDFRNFFYKTLIEYLQGQRDLDSCCDELNTTWQTAMKSFNPLTGTGID